ncbi:MULTISPECIES: VanW family protein [Alicyclobacillus]|uniref:VanW family protein n=1 Tax=Alicyclobacillus acidoterrestris (strain ATCC 49025 / DSM 3922 / CIP 106132 / NCIMB 13137 / GD3B) TaxID=1356854 RepID=T0C941_ALIAG|nr:MULTISPECIES: VanW family protein [Alicyclobacillus]EPZ52708.1 hypothetical protein N007_02665 [Alicyclobacillus acidoterrestris ATCC 49025]UNO48891.1 VanW family protein [Alicyclobacillus acidoterrestris]
MLGLLTITGFLGVNTVLCSVDNKQVHATPPQAPFVVSETSSAWTPAAKSSAQPYMPPDPSEPPGRQTAIALGLPYVLSERTTNYFHASPTQAKNIELVARRLNGTVVAPGETFSYNKHLGPYTAANGYGWGRAFLEDRIVPSMGGGVCQGASTLYSALLRTDLPIVERHQHGLTVPYLPPGEDATVSEPTLDFQFRNDTARPIVIGAATDQEERFFTVALWGAAPGKPRMVHHKVLRTTNFPTIHKPSDKLPVGQQRIVFPGQPGVEVETWVDNPNEGGHVERRCGVDHYSASPRVIEDGNASR